MSAVYGSENTRSEGTKSFRGVLRPLSDASFVQQITRNNGAEIEEFLSDEYEATTATR